MAVDVKPQTVSEWMKQKAFRDIVDAFRSELIHVTCDSIRGLGRKASRTIDYLMDHGSPAVRLAAAKYVLDTINLGYVTVECW
jgi:hypothetical protein